MEKPWGFYETTWRRNGNSPVQPSNQLLQSNEGDMPDPSRPALPSAGCPQAIPVSAKGIRWALSKILTLKIIMCKKNNFILNDWGLGLFCYSAINPEEIHWLGSDCESKILAWGKYGNPKKGRILEPGVTLFLLVKWESLESVSDSRVKEQEWRWEISKECTCLHPSGYFHLNFYFLHVSPSCYP